jgi:hypothetical protein
MKEILISKLFDYIRDNNPDILFALEAEDKLPYWLYDKVSSVERLMNELKKSCQPDHMIEETYISNLLEQEFEKDYGKLVQSGILQHEIINMVGYCQSVFDDLKFSEETEDSRFTYYAIAGAISEYLESNRESENVSNELQQSAEAEG